MNKQKTYELGWQPIETAPKEGSFIVTGGTINDELYRSYEPYHMAIVGVNTYEHTRHYYEVINTCHYSVWINNPTHWMPLPPLPIKE